MHISLWKRRAVRVDAEGLDGSEDKQTYGTEVKTSKSMQEYINCIAKKPLVFKVEIILESVFPPQAKFMGKQACLHPFTF